MVRNKTFERMLRRSVMGSAHINEMMTDLFETLHSFLTQRISPFRRHNIIKTLVFSLISCKWPKKTAEFSCLILPPCLQDDQKSGLPAHSSYLHFSSIRRVFLFFRVQPLTNNWRASVFFGVFSPAGSFTRLHSYFKSCRLAALDATYFVFPLLQFISPWLALYVWWCCRVQLFTRSLFHPVLPVPLEFFIFLNLFCPVFTLKGTFGEGCEGRVDRSPAHLLWGPVCAAQTHLLARSCAGKLLQNDKQWEFKLTVKKEHIWANEATLPGCRCVFVWVIVTHRMECEPQLVLILLCFTFCRVSFFLFCLFPLVFLCFLSLCASPQPPQPKTPEVPWAESDSPVFHLTDQTFDSFLEEHPAALVMFYAPCE